MRSLAITLAITMCCLAGCETTTAPPPPAEQAGYRAAARVISALEAFRQEHGHYPATLRELVPHYIRHVRQIAYSASWENQTNAFQYYPKNGRYGLDFTYYTSSQSHMLCYDSRTKKWKQVVID